MCSVMDVDNDMAEISFLQIWQEKTDLQKVLVIKKLPELRSKDEPVTYLEVVCKNDVEAVIWTFAQDFGLMVVVFGEPATDHEAYREKVQTKMLKDTSPKLEPLGEEIKGLFVSSISQGTTEDSLSLYFESKRSGGREECVDKVDLVPPFAVVIILDMTVVESILNRPQHKLCDHEIKVEPYYQNFHDALLQEVQKAPQAVRQKFYPSLLKQKSSESHKQTQWPSAANPTPRVPHSKARQTSEVASSLIRESSAHVEDFVVRKSDVSHVRQAPRDITDPELSPNVEEVKRPISLSGSSDDSDSNSGLHFNNSLSDSDEAKFCDRNLGTDNLSYSAQVMNAGTQNTSSEPVKPTMSSTKLKVFTVDEQGIQPQPVVHEEMRTAQVRPQTAVAPVRRSPPPPPSPPPSPPNKPTSIVAPQRQQEPEQKTLKDQKKQQRLVKDVKLEQVLLLRIDSFPKKFDSCTVKLEIDKCKVIFEGNEEAVDAGQVQMYKCLERAKECWTADTYADDVVEFLCEQTTKKHVVDLLKKNFVRAVVLMKEDQKLHSWAFSKEVSSKGLEMVKNCYVKKLVQIREGQQQCVGNATWNQFRDGLLKRYPLLKISCNMLEKVIGVVGVDGKKVDDCRNEIISYLKPFDVKTGEITLVGGKARCFQKAIEKELMQLIISSGSKMEVACSGLRDQLQVNVTVKGDDKAISLMTDKVKSIWHEKLDLQRIGQDAADIRLVCQGLTGKNGTKFLTNFEAMFMCGVDCKTGSASSSGPQKPVIRTEDTMKWVASVEKQPTEVISSWDKEGYQSNSGSSDEGSKVEFDLSNSDSDCEPAAGRSKGDEWTLVDDIELDGYKPPLPMDDFSDRPKHYHSRAPKFASESSDEDLPAQKVRSYRIQAGSISLRVKQADITHEQCPVLVNIVDPSGTFCKESRISRAFAKIGGRELEALYRDAQGQTPGCITMTTCCGNLKCDIVFHVRLNKKSQCHDIQQEIECVMQEAFDQMETWGQHYITFPPLGVGKLYGYPKDVVVCSMINMVVKFADTGRDPGIKGVTVVIFEPEVYKLFEDGLKKVESTMRLLEIPRSTHSTVQRRGFHQPAIQQHPANPYTPGHGTVVQQPGVNILQITAPARPTNTHTFGSQPMSTQPTPISTTQPRLGYGGYQKQTPGIQGQRLRMGAYGDGGARPKYRRQPDRGSVETPSKSEDDTSTFQRFKDIISTMQQGSKSDTLKQSQNDDGPFETINGFASKVQGAFQKKTGNNEEASKQQEHNSLNSRRQERMNHAYGSEDNIHRVHRRAFEQPAHRDQYAKDDSTFEKKDYRSHERREGRADWKKENRTFEKEERPPVKKVPLGADIGPYPVVTVKVFASSKKECESARSELSKAIKQEFLHEGSYPKLDRIADDDKKKIAKIMKDRNVIEKKGKEPKVCVLKGEKDNVLLAVQEVQSVPISAAGSTTKPTNPKAKRGTPEYWHHLATEYHYRFPRYWTELGSELSILETLKDMVGYDSKFATAKVDDQTQRAVEGLVYHTWQAQVVGQGKDAQGLTHQRIEVQKVERIENRTLYEKYVQKRQKLIRKLARTKKSSFPQIKQGSPKGCTADLMTGKANRVLQSDMYPEINEHFFFHGTKDDIIEVIKKDGFDDRVSSENAMLGRGVYCAESSTKADQYADSKTQRTSGKKHMFIVRMVLGEAYICTENNPPKYKRPPCKNCHKEICTDTRHETYDSVVGDMNKLFREFVVYDKDLCYPEYLVTYKRV